MAIQKVIGGIRNKINSTFGKKGIWGIAKYTFSLFGFKPWRVPSVENLSPYLTINGITNTPSVRYNADTATALGLPSWGYGPSLAKLGTGTPVADKITPGYSTKDLAMHGLGTAYYGADYDISMGVKDWVFEAVFYDGLDSKGNQEQIQTCYGSRGIVFLQRLSSDTLNMYVRNNDLSINTTFCASAVGAISKNSYYHVICFIDRSGSTQMYLNGVATGVATNISAYAAINADGDNKFSILAGGSGGSAYNGYLAYSCLWQGLNWLDTHEQDDIALERYVQYTGCQPQKSLGAGNPTVHTRASIAVLRKWNGLGYEGVEVGTNWPRAEKLSDGTLAYLAERASENGYPYSHDRSQWDLKIVGDDVTTNTDPGYIQNTLSYGLVCDATDDVHGVGYELEPAVPETHLYSELIWRPVTGALFDWIYVGSENSSGVQNINGYFDLKNGVVGSLSDALVLASFIEPWGQQVKGGVLCDGYRCTIEYDGPAAKHTHTCGPCDGDGDRDFSGGDGTSIVMWYDCAKHDYDMTYPSSDISTDGAVGARSADALRYASLNNIPREFEFSCEAYVPSNPGVGESIVDINDGSGLNRVTLYRNYSGGFTLQTVDSVSGQVLLATPVLSSYTWYKIRAIIKDNYVTLFYNDSQTLVDTTKKMPSGLTVMYVGYGFYGSPWSSYIRNIKIRGL